MKLLTYILFLDFDAEAILESNSVCFRGLPFSERISAQVILDKVLPVMLFTAVVFSDFAFICNFDLMKYYFVLFNIQS